MRYAVAATFIGLTLATPAWAQLPNVQSLLKGLTTGNQDQDRALHDAFERGYRRGRQDQADADHAGRDNRDRRPSDNRGNDQRQYDNGSRDNQYPGQDNNYGR